MIPVPLSTVPESLVWSPPPWQCSLGLQLCPFLQPQLPRPLPSTQWLLMPHEEMETSRVKGTSKVMQRILSPGPTRSQAGPFPHTRSRIYNKCKKEKYWRLRLGPERLQGHQGGRLPGQALPTKCPRIDPSQGRLPPASAHTQCQCVRTYARSPPWEPATSLCQRPLILPMWLRLSETLREGVGRTRKSETTSADSSFTARPLVLVPCRDWPVGAEKLGGQLTTTNDTLQAPEGRLTPVTQSGPGDHHS